MRWFASALETADWSTFSSSSAASRAGNAVDVRDQVRIIRFSFFSFMSSMRLISRSSTKGPFLLDLLNIPSKIPRAKRGRNLIPRKNAKHFFGHLALLLPAPAGADD